MYTDIQSAAVNKYKYIHTYIFILCSVVSKLLSFGRVDFCLFALIPVVFPINFYRKLYAAKQIRDERDG